MHIRSDEVEIATLLRNYDHTEWVFLPRPRMDEVSDIEEIKQDV